MLAEETPVKKKNGRPKKNQQQLERQQSPLLSAAQLLHLEAELYRQDFYEFFQACFEQITGNAYDEMWHVRQICHELQSAGLRLAKKQNRRYHYNVNVPPRSLKSVMMNVTFPVWLWLHNPKLKIITVTHSTALASGLIEDSVRLMQSEWFQARYGQEFKLGKANTEAYSNDKGGFRKAFGTSSHVMGVTADLILLDDVMDSRLANSDAYRTTILETIRKDVLSRQDNKSISLIINIQQRVHVEDMSGWILRSKGDQYLHIKLPSEAESADNVSPRSWYQYYQNGLLADIPGRFSRHDLDNEKIDKGSTGYAQQHLQEPVAPGGGMFKEEWFEKQILELDQWQQILNGRTPLWQLFIDGAETKDPKNDPTCLLLCCKLDNQLYVKEVTWVRQEFAQFLKTLHSYLAAKEAEGTPVRRALVEGKSIGKQIISMIRASTCTIPFSELSHKFGKEPKHVRANRAVPYVEARKLWLIKDTGCKEAWNEKFIQEVTSFTNGKGKTHDDAVDTMAYAIQNATTAKIGAH